MKIVFAGIIGRYPWGGVTWCSLTYLLGLRRLGHEVYYLEDTCECNFDPDINAYATEPGYALRYINESLEPFGFGKNWCYIDYNNNHHGMSRQACNDVCASADMLIVLSGGVWNWRDEYVKIPKKLYIDTDPGFTQLSLAKAINESGTKSDSKWYAEFFRQYDYHFTFGGNINGSDCNLPNTGFNWIPTTQPVSLEHWAVPPPLPSRMTWTTVMTWKMESYTDVGGNKDQEFQKVLDLANRCKAAGGPEFEIAVNGDDNILADNGWRCTDAQSASRDLWRYHNYLSSSRGEFSVAKTTYVSTRCGWFSDRTACYLAAGKPAVVQETGQSKWLPTGNGLLIWSTPDEAYEHLIRVEKDYDHHAKAAVAIAAEYLESTRVISDLLRKTD